MANLVQLHGKASSDEEAAAWLARLDRGLSAEEQARLREWLGQNARNADALLEMAALWDDLDVLAELSALLPLEAPVRRKAPQRRNRLFAASAAGVLAVVGITAFVIRDRVDDPLVAGPPARNLVLGFETSIGGQTTERLPDASTVTLNTNSEVRIEYSPGSREAFLLRGEVYFAVASDPDRPFRVHAAGSVIQAIGTAFNVKLAPDGDVEVTVTEGRVELVDPVPAAPGLPEQPRGQRAFDMTLIEGEVAILDPPDRRRDTVPQITRLEPAQVDVKLAWQRGMLIFEGEPLEAMLAEVERYTTADFVVEDEELARIRIGGYFRAGDVDGLLISLRENFDIESERIGGGTILLRAAL